MASDAPGGSQSSSTTDAPTLTVERTTPELSEELTGLWGLSPPMRRLRRMLAL